MRTRPTEPTPKTVIDVGFYMPTFTRRAMFAEVAITCIANELGENHKCSELDIAEGMLQWLLRVRAFERFPDLIDALNAEATRDAK